YPLVILGNILSATIDNFTPLIRNTVSLSASMNTGAKSAQDKGEDTPCQSPLTVQALSPASPMLRQCGYVPALTCPNPVPRLLKMHAIASLSAFNKQLRS